MIDYMPAYLLHDHRDTIRALAWSFDSTRLASLSIQHDQRVILWDTHTWKPVQEWASGGETTNVSFSPDGTTLYGTGPSTDIQVWNCVSGDARSIPTAYRHAGIRFDAAQQPFLIFCDDHHVGLADLHGQHRTLLTVPRSYSAIVAHCGWFNQDASLLIIEARDHHVLVWDVPQQMVIAHVAVHHAGIMDVAFDTQQRWIGIVSADGMVSVWDSDTWHCLHHFTSTLPEIFDLVLNSQRLLLALVNLEETIEVWDLQTWRLLAQLHGHGGELVAAWSPNGVWLASGGDDCQLRIWAV